MNKNFETVTIEGVSSNISEKFDFIKNENAIFLNTSDVLNNQILHMDYSNSIDLPGQAKKAIRKYDILLSEIRPGNKRFAYIDLDPKKFVVSTKFMVIRSHQNICSKYLFLFLTSKKILNQLQYIAERRSGTFPQITFDAIKHIELKLFNINNQKKIISIIENYDNLIENNTRRIQILEEMAQRIYKEWFVDFKYPGHENDKLVDSEFGMIPEGWSVKKLEKIVSEIIDYRGKTPKKLGSDWSDSGVMAISAKNVKQGKLINLDKSKFVDEKLYEKWMKTKLEVGDILMTSEAPLGELYYLNKYTRYCLSQRVFAIRADKVIIHPTILYCALGSQIIHEQIQMRRSGTTVAGIRQSELRKISIIVPSQLVQNKASDIFSSIFSKITTLQEIIDNLRQTRNLLLPKLISGKVDISDLDIDISILDD